MFGGPNERPMFDLTLPAPAGAEPELRPLENPVWTKHKARLIQLYLRFFVYVTRHGTYIDGFAGAQHADRPDMWAAKLVLETEPWRLRNFYLFEKNRTKAAGRQALSVRYGRDVRGTRSD
jgi:hypothetical protein